MMAVARASTEQRSELGVDDFQSASSVEDLFPDEDPVDAYMVAKRTWYDLVDTEEQRSSVGELPGERVRLDEYAVTVHGVPHNAVGEEAAYMSDAIRSWVDAGERVFVEQGLYRKSVDGGVYDILEQGPEEDLLEEMDDVSWAKAQLADDLGQAEEIEPVLEKAIEGTTGTKTRAASHDIEAVEDLQQHYRRVLLPVHLEREWLRERYPRREVSRHGRSEEMADYVVNYMADGNCDEVHVLVGAAHQPAVVEYLRQYRDGEREIDPAFSFHGDSTQVPAVAAELQDYEPIMGYRDEGAPHLEHDHEWEHDTYAATLEWYAEWQLGGGGAYDAVAEPSDGAADATTVVLHYTDEGETQELARVVLESDVYSLSPISAAPSFPEDHEEGMDHPLDDGEAAFMVNVLEEYLSRVS